MKTLEAIKQKINKIDDENKLFIAKNLVARDPDIEKIKSDLGVHLPKSYQWFLKTYGAGGVNGVFIEGMGTPDHRYAVVEETLDFRKDHPSVLPEWVFLEWFSDDWVCLLDTSGCHETTEECPVIVYQIGEDRWEKGWDTFADYLEERFFGGGDDRKKMELLC
ncbi:SMI1/KNR4 family protein [Acidithiobacillus thiooxidans]|uniref:SMI1/KNR4 family protein n=1 Tax=Acidithiobacillus sulfurivorans TaxID=1958756 RepID=A0ABS6A0H9_9PROT|nr:MULTISPECIES: SMI1/KNR4 family protein [Acidithiobacillus]MBU2741859.1 SMI1/KNR4 family protein [Acidithiobacillus albertensis]MBU2760944.1 SMI1/KNR4 family protein [Acidithiobacillus sulfurivorans]MBU2792768.1 SMI1/KNR4 family protein [Acidithiobacillus thiooxidans]